MTYGDGIFLAIVLVVVFAGLGVTLRDFDNRITALAYRVQALEGGPR